MSGRTFLAGLLLAGLLGASAPAASSTADLTEAKLQAARKTYDATIKAMQTGQTDAEKVYVWSRRVLEGERDRGAKKADHAAALEAHLGRMKELREMTTQRYRAGQLAYAEVLGTEFYVKEAELWVEQAGEK
jgi:hypothetical protein